MGFHVQYKAIKVKPKTDAFYPWDEPLNVIDLDLDSYAIVYA